MFGKKNYNGITPQSPENIQIDAGAFFVNYDVENDTYASAKQAGKMVGITDGGGEFSAKPTLRQIVADGAGGRVKGLTDIDEWEVYLKLTFKEMTVDNIKRALAASTSDTTALSGYTKIEGKSSIAAGDYIDNITWIGCKSGTTTPIIIQVFNTMNEDGLTLTVQDKSEGKVTVTFYAYNDLSDYEADTVEPPFAIYIPDNSAAIVPAKATYDDNTAGDDNKNIVVTLVGNATLTSVKNGTTTLTANTDYIKTGSKISIQKSYLTTLTGTSATLTFETSDDADPTLTITLTDTAE